MAELAPRLRPAERKATHPNLRPRDAASLILVEWRGGEPHVLVGRRSHEHVFYPGAFVFPGGRVDTGDGSVPAADEFPDPVVKRLMAHMKGRPSARRARALALAAIRETFEETGILLGVRQQRELKGKSGEWADFFAHGVIPDLSQLSFVCRAITPPRRARRYDTRFFAAETDAIAASLPLDRRPTLELSEILWVPIAEAGTLRIPAITQTVLEELEARLRLPDGLRTCAPVPFYYMRRGSFVREIV